MTYRRHYRAARPQVRTIVAKFPGACACCGAVIKAGEMVEYFPIGTIAGRSTAAVAHTGGLDGRSARCSMELRKMAASPDPALRAIAYTEAEAHRQRVEAAAANDYAGDGLDERWEDAGAEICGR